MSANIICDMIIQNNIYSNGVTGTDSATGDIREKWG